MRHQPLTGESILKIYGDLEKASLESLTSDPGTSQQGRVYQNTTTDKVMHDNGTTKRALLRNDDKVVIGNDGTAANNSRLHKGSGAKLQITTGADATADGTDATTLAQTSSRTENYTNAGKPAAGNIGRLVYLTDLDEVKADNGSGYSSLTKLNSIAPTTTKGDLIVYSTTNTRLPVGSNGQFLKADSTQTTGLVWAAANPLLSVRSVTSTDTATTADDVLYLSGASFTQNLFTAVGNSGKVLEIIHDGTSLTQIYTIDPSGAQTINGAATYVLYTNGERIRFVSDGANWKKLSIYTDHPWTAYTPTTAAMGTPTNVSFHWMRRGDTQYVRGNLKVGTVTGALATITIAGSQAIDTAKLAGNQTDLLGNWIGNVTTAVATLSSQTRGYWPISLKIGDTDKVFLTSDVDLDGVASGNIFNSTASSNFSGIAASNSALTVEFSVPITGWNV